MSSSSNRLMAGLLLLAMFGVIALAGSRAAVKAQAPTNVVVTNTSSQPIPIAARPGTGAYIVSVANQPSVKIGNTTAAPANVREANNPDVNEANLYYSFNLGAGVVGSVNTAGALSLQPVIIENVSVKTHADTAGEFVDEFDVQVVHNSSIVSTDFHPVAPLATSQLDSILGSVSHTFVPAGDTVTFGVFRHGTIAGNVAGNVSVTYHVIAVP